MYKDIADIILKSSGSPTFQERWKDMKTKLLYSKMEKTGE